MAERAPVATQPDAIAASRLAAVRAWVPVAALAGVVAVGVIVRAVPALGGPFPNYDGGLFGVMIEAIRAGGLHLPPNVQYAGHSIPFDYPPLALVAAAATPLGTIDALRILPLVAAILTVPAVYLVAAQLLPTKWHAIAGALFFAVVPGSWEHVVTGGGLTRAPGFLFSLLAAWQFLRLFDARKRRHAVGAGAFAGLAALCHPEAAAMTALVLGVVAVMRARRRSDIWLLVLVGLAGALTISPWLAWLAANGRLGDLTSAAQSGFSPTAAIVMVITLRLTGEYFAPLVLAACLLGLIVLLAERRFLIPLWLASTAVLAARQGPTYITAPVAMAAAVGVLDGIGLLVAALPAATAAGARRRATVAVEYGLLLTVAWGFLGSLALAVVHELPVYSLTADTRSTMEWIRTSTPSDARFLVVGGVPWWNDLYGEWFDLLAARPSLATVQGSEWLGRDAWDHRLAAYDDLQACGQSDAACLLAWARQNGAGGGVYAYLVRPETLPLPNGPGAGALILSVEHDARFEIVRSAPDGIVVRLPRSLAP